MKKIENANGTHLQGYLEVSYKELTQAFGEPHATNDIRDDITTEWRFKIEGEIITIYDWKEYRQRDDIPLWNIGGHSPKVLEILLKYFARKDIKSIVEVHSRVYERYLYR